MGRLRRQAIGTVAISTITFAELRYGAEKMFAHFVFVDFDAQARAIAGADEPTFCLDCVAFADNVAAPRNVGVDGLADDVARRGQAEFQGRGGADRALSIVRGDGNAMR